MEEPVKIVKLPVGAQYSLSRKRDGAGDSGSMLLSLRWPEGKAYAAIHELEQVGENGELHLGCRVQCGTPMARSFGSDWWLTTEIDEFLEVSPEQVVFKTVNNSIYTVKSRGGEKGSGNCQLISIVS